ncbi:hypothetical protein [Aquaticitalea lipolytica]|uniref:hypothetical protein n=1 Tax=Aquaticitalea lipolytica TaxID=1247562 RepID=UPI0024BA143C|nr:hypothetical protein [Aquaticitalea lipolytica]
MKHKLKNYIKLGILLFGILFLVTNCENEPIKEIHAITKPSFKTSKINLSNFKNKDKVFKKLNDVSKNTTNLQNRTVYDSINNFFVNTESVILIEYEEYHWLTFNIERDYETNLLENLILKYNAEHDTYQAFISEYDITDEERELLSQGGFIPNLEHKTTFYPIVEFNNNILNRPGDIIPDPITGNCYMIDDVIRYTDGTFVVTYIQVDCPGGAGNNSNNNGDGNGSGTETGNDTDNTDTNNSNNDGDSTQYGGGGGADTNDENAGDTNLPDDLDNTVATLPNIDNTCNKLSKVSNSPSFQLRMQELIANTVNNTEIFYYGRHLNNGNMDYSANDRYEGQPNFVGVDVPLPNTKVDSFIHNHFNNGNGTLSVFSGSDLYSLYELYINDKIKDLSKFVMVVTTPGNNISSTDDDTVYAITINNSLEFATFGTKFLTDPLIVDVLLYNDRDNKIDKNISNELNEERFVRMLQKNSSGMSVYRGNRTNLNS